MNNQTMSIVPAELFFSLGRLAAISSLLFIVILVLIIIFLLFFQQRNTSHFDEHELRSDTDAATTENKILELSSFKQYASTDNHHLIPMTTSINSSQAQIDDPITRSTTNLISSP